MACDVGVCRGLGCPGVGCLGVLFRGIILNQHGVSADITAGYAGSGLFGVPIRGG